MQSTSLQLRHVLSGVIEWCHIDLVIYIPRIYTLIHETDEVFHRFATCIGTEAAHSESLRFDFMRRRGDIGPCASYKVFLEHRCDQCLWLILGNLLGSHRLQSLQYGLYRPLTSSLRCFTLSVLVGGGSVSWGVARRCDFAIQLLCQTEFCMPPPVP